MNPELIIKKNHQTYIIPYQIIKSSRKSVGIEVKPGGNIIVRIPKYLPSFELNAILDKKKDWLLDTYQKQKEKPAIIDKNDKDPQIIYLEKQYKKAANDYFTKRVEYYIEKTGGTYTHISIRDQKTRWGSCSNSGTLSFNWRLMLAPPRVLDYVVVHELCHLTYMNHSKDFWNKVSQIMPDYKMYRDWLKKNGSTLTLS